jgi:hypothetical protein
VDSAVAGKRVKMTKTRVERDVALDAATVAMLERHCAERDERAALFGVEVPSDGFVVSLEPDWSLPMPAEYLTRQLAVLKPHLGISTKGPDTIALEDKALRLFRQPPGRRPPGNGGRRQRAACRSPRSAGSWVARSRRRRCGRACRG